MIVHLGLLILAALGHFCLFAALINWSHALTYMPKWVDRAILVVVLLCVAATLAGAAWLILHPWNAYPAETKAYLILCAINGGVVFPCVTIARLFRAIPPGIHGSSSTVDLAAENGSQGMIGDGSRAWWLKIPGNESLMLRVNHWRVTQENLPTALDGLTILHLTDLHFAPTYGRGYFDRVMDLVAAESVDLVLFTGDLIDDMETLPWIVPVLSRLRGDLGAFAILGNHDFHYDTHAIAKEIERAGFEMIEGRWRVLETGGVRVAIGGNGAPWGPRPEQATKPDADYSILLSHAPDQFNRAASEGVDLMFSGHNHGGQVRLPVFGPILMPSRYGRRFDRGFFRKGRTLLYSNQGVGAKHPLRWNCPPEVAFFELRSARASTSRSASGSQERGDRLTSAV